MFEPPRHAPDHPGPRPDTGDDGGEIRLRRVLVTGPSGAGRSTAIRALEDLGYEAIDNLPLSLMPRLLDGPGHDRPLALGIDTRNREFSANALIEMIDAIGHGPGRRLDVLYLDCREDVLLRRFSETRRRHPLAPAESPNVGIARDFDLLMPVRARADILIDTSDMTPHDLRAEVEGWFAPDPLGRRLAVSVNSFSYKRGLPRGIDMVFDCRFLRNPYWDPALRALDGRDTRVAGHVAGDARFAEFFDRVAGLMRMLLPAYAEEGKAHLSVAFGCTGGQHRSVALAEKLAKALAEEGWPVSIRHRELERHASAPLRP
ncbi:RNase adapter RapZ [Aquicoccus porphyridii]|uniref:RNase adapter RapZ n=1 Tax=Aquicoccus porphyridii TaxID=1852029 RepID=A0A5A9ZG50_9RHOB|nr:RNase adapter RapZ [Aquicoccus porphyridii]KAA0916211.1 RNase adapter RapZ [Aquicoccus porphyridii]RAI53658.1 RNase adapter RapZ [Rhodobacteraceae bacterium AsT-22]